MRFQIVILGFKELNNDKGILGVLSIVPNCLEISIETLDLSRNFFAKMVYLWNSFPLTG